MKPFILNTLLATSLLGVYPLVRCEDHAPFDITTRESRAPIHARDFTMAVEKREATHDTSTIRADNEFVDVSD